MQVIQQDRLLSIHLVLDGFSRAARVLAGELRGLEAAGSIPGRGAGEAVAAHSAQAPVSSEFVEGIWHATVQAYLSSSARRFAAAGYTDVAPGYSHLLPVLSSSGVAAESEACRKIVGRMSNEICRLLGRLILLTAENGPGAFEEGVRSGRRLYLRAFRLHAATSRAS